MKLVFTPSLIGVFLAVHWHSASFTKHILLVFGCFSTLSKRQNLYDNVSKTSGDIEED